MLANDGIWSARRSQVTLTNAELSQFQPMRLRLPYGEWTEGDGTRVMFSRDYFPLWRISLAGTVSADEPWRAVRHTSESFHWGDHNPPWTHPTVARAMEGLLNTLGIVEPPTLMRAVPMLIAGEADDIADAVSKLVPIGAEPYHRYG